MCVGVLSFVSVRLMSSMVSCSRLPPVVRVLFPKLSCLLLKSPVSMMLSRPKQNPSMISLEGLPLGQYNVEMCSVPALGGGEEDGFPPCITSLMSPCIIK